MFTDLTRISSNLIVFCSKYIDSAFKIGSVLVVFWLKHTDIVLVSTLIVFWLVPR